MKKTKFKLKIKNYNKICNKMICRTKMKIKIEKNKNEFFVYFVKINI